MVFMAKIKSKKEYIKIDKKIQKNKLLPRVKEVICIYLENGCNVSKTAQQIKVNRTTLIKLLDTPEAKEEIKRSDEQFSILKQTARRVLISNSLKDYIKAKNNMEKKELAYFLAHITGLGREVEVAKIQAGVGQVTTTTNHLDRPLTPEQLERYIKTKKIMGELQKRE